MPRWYPPIGRPIGTPPRDTHITWPWRLRPAVSYQSSGAASAPGGNTPRALYGAGADGHPEAPDRRPLGACPYRRQCAECSPPKFIDGVSQTVMGSAIESACRARICRSSSPAAPASCEMPGSLPHVTGSDAGRARFALPLAGLFSTRCLPRRSLARPWRCRRPLSQRHACSFPLAAVPLSHLAPAISMARNSRSTSRFQLCRSPNENAEVPAAFRNGHFECELSVGISLAACSVTLMAGSTCVRGVLARRTESSGESRQIQPVRRCGRAH